jgi:hypothetical protein
LIKNGSYYSLCTASAFAYTYRIVAMKNRRKWAVENDHSAYNGFSKQVNCRLSTGHPLAADYVGCEAGRRTCSKRETRTEEQWEIKWDYHIVGTTGY